MIKKLIILLTVGFLLASCSQVVIRDAEIKAHWMKKGDIAPYDGVLLNEYTYIKIRKKLENCKEKEE